ncbi:hypothetical protein [Nonomuraea phyllanthi]|uniref:hypothetical protein n=1 Tax=Nonomuraea phyllanthi TaxID=2219224 RepID=UPI0018858AD9|nr:hypothetical protein [Nonomuraea phyllanthi]
MEGSRRCFQASVTSAARSCSRPDAPHLEVLAGRVHLQHVRQAAGLRGALDLADEHVVGGDRLDRDVDGRFAAAGFRQGPGP